MEAMLVSLLLLPWRVEKDQKTDGKSWKCVGNWKDRYDQFWYLFITKLIVVSNYHHYGANYSIWCLSRMKLTHREFQRNLNAKKEHLVCSKIKQEINLFLIFLSRSQRAHINILIDIHVWCVDRVNIQYHQKKHLAWEGERCKIAVLSQSCPSNEFSLKL